MRSVKDAVDMANRMASGTGGRTYTEAPSVATPKPRPVSEDEYLARLYGGTPASAHQRKQWANRFAADVIRFRREGGDTEAAAVYARPVEMALCSWPEKQPGNAEERASVADAEEDVTEARYRAHPCVETARPLLRKRALDRECSMEYDREIAARFGIEL